jgi:hypothetical protein
VNDMIYPYKQVTAHVGELAVVLNENLLEGFIVQSIINLPDPMQKIILLKMEYRRPNFTPNKVEIKDKKKKK